MLIIPRVSLSHLRKHYLSSFQKTASGKLKMIKYLLQMSRLPSSSLMAHDQSCGIRFRNQNKTGYLPHQMGVLLYAMSNVYPLTNQ
jgi:hypothetical protein